MRLATVATFSAPVLSSSLSSQMRRANTVLTEERVAESSVMMPRPRPSLFDTFQGGFVGMTAGEDESTYREGGIPSSIAVTSTKVLNEEPGWRRPWVARLNLLVR
jgi:hypothetical protein